MSDRSEEVLRRMQQPPFLAPLSDQRQLPAPYVPYASQQFMSQLQLIPGIGQLASPVPPCQPIHLDYQRVNQPQPVPFFTPRP